MPNSEHLFRPCVVVLVTTAFPQKALQVVHRNFERIGVIANLMCGWLDREPIVRVRPDERFLAAKQAHVGYLAAPAVCMRTK